jgi:acetylornithine deacetylase
MEAFLNDHGVRTMRDGCNVWVRGGNPDPAAPVLLLNSHLDTVRPASTWTRDPFTPEVKDGTLYGLGSNDAGAALCAMAAAFLALRDTDLPFALVYAATAEEEIAGTGGIERALPLIGRVDAAIVGEPTGMQMAVAERGLVVLDCIAHGRAGHAARSTGVNAIELAMRDIEWFRTFRFPRVSALLGDVKMTVTQISAGVQHNVIPEKCSFVVDVRVPDTYTLEEVVETVRAHVVCDAVPRSLRLRSSSIDMAHPLVAAARACGIGTFASPTLSDQARIAAPSVKLGPGLSERSHTADEFITEAEFRAGVDGYIALLTALTLEASDETVG